jgi:3-oxoacyl-[acyl-carrier protein] reductase
MNDLNELKDKIALVTGASRGIGRAIAIALAKAGANVVVNYRARENEAKEVCSQISSLHGHSLPIRADVSLASDVARLVKTIEQEMGAVNILINNAGIGHLRSIDEITEADWDETITVNLKSVFLMTQAVLAGMRARQWGRIINLSSLAAQTGGIIGPHYTASKAGIVGLTHYYAAHLAKEGITVNAIAPALIDTEMITGNLRARAGLIPVGRLGTVEEIAEAAIMIARNGFITGQTINVNGGWYMT